MNGPNQEMKLKGELVFWRIILKGRIQERIRSEGSICLKLLEIGPYVIGIVDPPI